MKTTLELMLIEPKSKRHAKYLNHKITNRLIDEILTETRRIEIEYILDRWFAQLNQE